jgi:hypothetical protein
MNQSYTLNPTYISNTIDPARLACQGDKAIEDALYAAAASKQPKIVPNL